MAVISYEKFLEIFNLIPYHSECVFYFFDTKETYMLIKYEANISFQRCSYSDEMINNGWPADYRGSGEIFYKNFEELYVKKTVDDICLRDSWGKVEVICVNSSFNLPDEMDDILAVYGNKS